MSVSVSFRLFLFSSGGQHARDRCCLGNVAKTKRVSSAGATYLDFFYETKYGATYTVQEGSRHVGTRMWESCCMEPLRSFSSSSGQSEEIGRGRERKYGFERGSFIVYSYHPFFLILFFSTSKVKV